MTDKKEFFIWEGVYGKWEDAPEKEGAFASSRWLNSVATQTTDALKELQQENQFISCITQNREYLLPLVISMLIKEGAKLKVLDFGGGLASGYLLAGASSGSVDGIEYHVVEGTELCDRSHQLFSDEKNLQFHDEIPLDIGSFDIIHASRSIQYVDDWRGLLSTFAELEPRYIVLAGVLAGDIEPFVSVQNYYGFKIRVRFLNLQDLVGEMDKLGYSVIYKSYHLSERMGRAGPLPMDNFPEDRRIEHPCQLLFKCK